MLMETAFKRMTAMMKIRHQPSSPRTQTAMVSGRYRIDDGDVSVGQCLDLLVIENGQLRTAAQ